MSDNHYFIKMSAPHPVLKKSKETNKTNKKRWETKKNFYSSKHSSIIIIVNTIFLRSPNWSTKGSFCKKVLFILEDH